MTRVVVVGSGVAGLTAALEADARDGVEVTLVTKAALGTSNTAWAQGGVAVVTDAGDSVASHVADTLAAGAGLSDDDAVQVLCADGPEAVAGLMRRGVLFDVDAGDLARGLEAAHSHARILHAGGDATGAAISEALVARVRAAGIEVREHTLAVDLQLTQGRVCGLRLLDGTVLPADAVVLATGGAGQLYPFTTNPAVATGDGLAMALRAGAVASDLEFYQFHPTALAVPGSPLVSEAVRGEGAVLRSVDGHRFMTDVHPDAELAPRDVVARGIAAQMARQGGLPVLLDATALGTAFLARRFPTIDAMVRSHGLDWGTEPVPVSPAAHYFMGGVRTDLWGRTSLPGLYAVGEVACTGVHGANRLASNSLLEGAVFGRRVVEAVLGAAPQETFDAEWAAPVEVPSAVTTEPLERADLQQLLWETAGLSRDAAGLERASTLIGAGAVPPGADVKAVEDANLHVVGAAVVASALARRESRGGHHRTDAPGTDPTQARHSAVVLPAARLLIAGARESVPC
ncbi:L-aspartate oxidase [Aeromicrobium sp. Leaf272]|uniref:L-aspartate oxidase n=1 Tax=Aeromicrobium sp. Leaf272 TaxID=1736317 RepID=UPI0006F20471|nr:L-aspartate oxidase [Aeromicrobium sp. Leaf272]KQP25490.1 L-aspartate oxidase [Aeromicrobium sp. Leaf272]